MGGATLDCFSKRWDPVFSTDPVFKEDWSQSWVDKKRAVHGDFCGGLELFLRDSDPSIPDIKIEELLEFAASFSLEELKAGVLSGQRRGAWLDERSSPDCNTSQMREHKNPLTATRFYERVKTRRIGNKNLPDANRRLVYIETLDAPYMLALAETARFHEVALLKDALWNHIAGRTLLRVRIPTKGHRVFQLQFHLKYFVCRLLPPDGETWTPKKHWTDLSFLEIQTLKPPEGRKYGMFESRFSVVVCGSSEKQWVVYAFDDTESDGDDLQEKMTGALPLLHEDPIVSCLDGDKPVDADLPIWNPRRYFLLAVANRITRAANGWMTLMTTVERSIKNYTKMNPSTLSHQGGSTKGRGDSAKKAFDWSHQTEEFLSRLQDALSRTNKSWEQFKSFDDGDIGYFLDVESPDDKRHINNSLREIKEKFEELGEVSGTLETLMETCKDYANHLQLRLNLESNETTKSNGAAQDFTLFVLGPPALAAACLQLSPSMVPLPLPPTRESLIILTGIFWVTMKILYLIRGALPEINWWWRIMKDPVKKVNLGDVGNPLSVCCTLGRRVRKHRNDIDSKTQDV